MYPLEIGRIIHRETGDDDGPSEKEKEKEKEKQKRLKSLLPYARAFQMFKDNNSIADIAIELDRDTDTVLNYYGDYLRLVRMKGLIAICDELKDDLSILINPIDA